MTSTDKIMKSVELQEPLLQYNSDSEYEKNRSAAIIREILVTNAQQPPDKEKEKDDIISSCIMNILYWFF